MLCKPQTRKKYTYIFFILFSLFFCILSDKCLDENCENCSADGSFCFFCKKNLIKFQHRCFQKTKKIKNCILSNTKENYCVKCNYGCSPKNGICTCTLKYILYLIYALIIIITIGTFLYCLTHNTLAKFYNFNSHLRFRTFNEVINNNNEINNSIRVLNINHDNDNEWKKSEEELIEEFDKNKSVINAIDIENKKCDCCNNFICNLYLDCGCFVCFDCEKKSLKESFCLKCHQKFKSMRQVSCSICLNNKKELGFFNCQCKMVICKDCYIKWRNKNKNCPTCRTFIL